MSELKACPFCGTNKIEIEVEGNFSWGECHVCGATSEAHRQYSDFNIEQRKEGASKKWNTRPIEDALRSENERMQKEVVASRNFIEDILGRATKSQLRAIAPFHAKYRSALSGEPTVQSLFEKKRSHEEDMDFINKINGD